jgi:hypothetical protein
MASRPDPELQRAVGGTASPALNRLEAGAPNLPHILFGPLTHDQWINTHLHRAELHLSFIAID